MESHVEYNSVRSTCAQVLATVSFSFLCYNVGLIITMPAFVIGALRVYDTSLTITEEQASWLGGLLFMVQPLGSVVSGVLQDWLGRKTCSMMINIPQLVAWIMMYYATSVATLYAAIVILGLSIAFMEAPVLSYVGEITEPKLRGVLCTLGLIFYNMGHLFEVFTGATVHWRTMVLLNCSGPVAAFLAIAFMPESPVFLINRGRLADAHKSFQWLRGWIAPQDVQQELDALVAHAENSRKPRPALGSDYKPVPTKESLDGVTSIIGQECKESVLKNLLHPSVLRPLRLIVVYYIMGSTASLLAMRPFLIEILSNMPLAVSPHTFMVIASILTLIGTLSCSLGMRRFGKRGLTILSLSLSAFCCFSLGIYLTLGVNIPWLPVILFGLSFYAAPLGIMSISMMLISELFPIKNRGMSAGVTAAIGYLIMFVTIKTFYNVESSLGLAGSCIVYGAVGLAGFIFLYWRLPETEGIPLEAIERLFTETSSKAVSTARSMRRDIALRRIEREGKHPAEHV